MTPEDSEASPIAVMVEDPGALNFLVPLVDGLIKQGMPVLLFGVGVGARQLGEKGYEVISPPLEHDAEQALRTYRCRLLIIGTSEDPHTLAFALVRAARLSQIPSVGIVDAAVNAQFRFRGTSDEPLAHVPDWLMVPDELTAIAFDCLGFPRGRIAIVGNPARDLARRRAQCLRQVADYGGYGRSREQYRLVFISEISDGLDPEQYMKCENYTLTGRGTSRARTAIVAEELLDARSALRDRQGINTVLVLRLHPKQVRSDLGALCDEFDEVSIGGDPLEVVASADLVIGMASMLLLQAHEMGLPCLSVLPRKLEKSWLPDVAEGVIPSVTDRTSLRAALFSLLVSHPEPSLVDKAGEITSDAVAAMMTFLVDFH